MLDKLSRILSNKENKSTFITLVLRGGGVLLLFGFTLFFTNNYPAAIVGEYEIVRSFLLVVGTITVLGTDQSIFYFSGKLISNNDIYGLKGVYFTILKLLFICTSAFTLFYFILPEKWIISFYNNDYSTYSYVSKAVFILIFYSIFTFNTEMLRALNHIHLSEMFRNFFKHSFVILGCIVFINSDFPYRVVDFFIFGFVILAFITTFIVYKSLSKLPQSDSKQQIYISKLKDIVLKSYPMAISGIGFLIMLSVDLLLLKKHFGNDTVAHYAVAVKLLTILSMVIVAINVNAAPKISEFYFGGKTKELHSQLKKSRKLICFVNLPAGIFLILFGKQILHFFGEDYADAYIPMIILVSGQICASLFGSTAVTLNMIGKQKFFQFIIIGATLINIILNVILIPKLGMTGAATAYVAGLLFWNLTSHLTYNYFFRNIIK